MRNKRRNHKLSVSLLFGTAAAGTETVAAAPDQRTPNVEQEYPTGGLLSEIKELPRGSVSEDSYFHFPEKSEKSLDKKSATYNHPWDQYRNYYFYKKMTEAERAFYDKLDIMCCYYLQTEKPAASETYENEELYFTGLFSTDGLTREEAQRVVLIFRYSSPQYYFIDSDTWWAGENMCGLGIYKAFVDGGQRKAETAKVQKKLDEWSREVVAGATDYDKARIAHDLISENVSYNNDFYDDEDFDEETAFSQSVYSAFCLGTTVCAGYAQAFEMLCNGAGIDTISVTSEIHEWNKIRLNDSWYNVDCTWDDYDWEGENRTYYDYFVRSDEAFDREDGLLGDPESQGTHMEESIWDGRLPACSLDSGSTNKAPGTLPEITAKTAAPAISCDKDTGTITLSCETKNADIYYSLDGTAPSPSSVKCRLYHGKAVSADNSGSIRAVAVADACLDSDPKEGAPRMIQFHGNGATSGSMQALRYDGFQQKTLPANAYNRTGYTFAGWNTKADGTGKKYANRQTVKNLTVRSGGKVTLYAQWKKTKYKVKYNLRGGENNKKNPRRYYYTSKTVKLKKATRRGYAFKGWYADKKYKKRIKAIKKGSTGNITLYAKWQKKK